MNIFFFNYFSVCFEFLVMYIKKLSRMIFLKPTNGNSITIPNSGVKGKIVWSDLPANSETWSNSYIHKYKEILS